MYLIHGTSGSFPWVHTLMQNLYWNSIFTVYIYHVHFRSRQTYEEKPDGAGGDAYVLNTSLVSFQDISHMNAPAASRDPMPTMRKGNIRFS
jgi:hypothetical protein